VYDLITGLIEPFDYFEENRVICSHRQPLRKDALCACRAAVRPCPLRTS
jgi:hypothetical protein